MHAPQCCRISPPRASRQARRSCLQPRGQLPDQARASRFPASESASEADGNPGGIHNAADGSRGSAARPCGRRRGRRGRACGRPGRPRFGNLGAVVRESHSLGKRPVHGTHAFTTHKVDSRYYLHRFQVSGFGCWVFGVRSRDPGCFQRGRKGQGARIERLSYYRALNAGSVLRIAISSTVLTPPEAITGISSAAAIVAIASAFTPASMPSREISV